jgi:hypothetical protein
MSDDTEVVHGHENAFRAFGYPDAELRQAKAMLAAEIIKVLDRQGFCPRGRPRLAPTSPTPNSPASATRG